MRIGLFISTTDGASLDEIIARFAAAEEAGFHTAWAGHTFEWDALTLLALAGRATRRIELGSWVVPSFPRHPVALAQQALTTQSACANRLALGVGVSHAAVIEKRMGIDYAHPLKHMREYLSVLPGLLAGEHVEFRGERFRIAARIDPLGAKPPSIVLAALGPRMLELAGQRAQGVAIWLGGERYLEDFALAHIERAAAAVGRTSPRVIVGLPVCVTRHPTALAAAERFLGPSSRLPAYRGVLEREGVESPGHVALIGDEDALARRLGRIAALGVTDFNAIVFGVKDDPEAIERTRSTLAGFAREASRTRPRGA